jgi:glucosylceramidase
MKTTGTMIGGELKREWYSAYAQYFVKFIQAYAAEGITIAAVTVQNEPGVDRARDKDPKWFYPSCRWTALQERDFIRDHLGPAFRRARLTTKIWCYDHNYNVEAKEDSAGLSHPRTILRDPAAAAFVDGVGFHHYEGKAEGMTQFHTEFPGLPIHFTEGSVFSIWGGYDLVERFRNWATSYNAWVAILDEQGRPNNGPFPATKAILRYNSQTGRAEEIFEYFNYGHFMKFIRRGAIRMDSTPSSQELSHVAFRNPDGTRVLVMANTTDRARNFTVTQGARSFATIIPRKSVMTCQW